MGLLISALFLYFAFKDIAYDQLGAALASIRWIWLLPGLGLYFLGVGVRAWRWQLLLKPLRQISLRTLFPVVAIGYMGNNVFPLRMGEVLRSVVLKRRLDVPISGSLATIVVERIFDAVVIVGFVLLNLGQLLGISGGSGLAQVGSLATWAVVIFAAGLIVFILMAVFPAPAQLIIHKIIQTVMPQRFRSVLYQIADRFLDGLLSLRSPRDAMMIFVTSIMVWILETGLYWSVDQALGLGLTFGQLMLLNGVVNLVLLIPAAPGGLGTFDAAGRAMLEGFSIPAESALAYTLVLRVALWVPITIIGAIFFIREGLKWTTDVSEMRAQADGKEELT